MFRHAFASIGQLFRAIGAGSLYHVVDGMGVKALRNVYQGYAYRLETRCFLALFAIEVNVLVENGVAFVAVTQFVFEGTAAILYYMDDVLLCKKLKGSEDACLVYRES